MATSQPSHHWAERRDKDDPLRNRVSPHSSRVVPPLCEAGEKLRRQLLPVEWCARVEPKMDQTFGFARSGADAACRDEDQRWLFRGGGIDPDHAAHTARMWHTAVNRDVTILIEQDIAWNTDEDLDEFGQRGVATVIAPEKLLLRQRRPKQLAKARVPVQLILTSFLGSLRG